MFIASAIVALANNKPKLGVLAVIGIWCEIMTILLFFEHPNLLTLLGLSLFWGFCAATFWEDVLDSALTGVVRIKQIVKTCCGPRDFVIVSRKYLALYSGSRSSPPLATFSLIDCRGQAESKRVDKPFLERTQICYKYLGDEFIGILRPCDTQQHFKDLQNVAKSAPLKLCPPIQVVEIDSDGDNDVTDIFKRFYLAHFPQTKTLYDFGLVVAGRNDIRGPFKLRRTGYRFTHSISDKTAEYSIDFADPSQSLILDVILRDLEDEDQDGAEETDPLITELKQVQKEKGLTECKGGCGWKRAHWLEGEVRDKHFSRDKEKEEAERPSTPITETFEEDPHDIDRVQRD